MTFVHIVDMNQQDTSVSTSTQQAHTQYVRMYISYHRIQSGLFSGPVHLDISI